MGENRSFATPIVTFMLFSLRLRSVLAKIIPVLGQLTSPERKLDKGSSGSMILAIACGTGVKADARQGQDFRLSSHSIT